jgi:alpha-glucosidase
LAGGSEVTIDAPLGRIPLFALGGSMIATSEKRDGVDPRQALVRRLLVFARSERGTSSAELYDDDGLTPDWNKGAGRRLVLQLQSSAPGRAQLSASSSGAYVPPYGRVRVEAIGGEVALAPGAESLLTL